jgi:hypothetical protein
MVDLVKGQPEAIGVTKPMSPVEDEGARDPVNEAFDYRVRPIPPIKQRMVAEVAVPRQPAESDERQLNQIDCNRASVPAA